MKQVLFGSMFVLFLFLIIFSVELTRVAFSTLQGKFFFNLIMGVGLMVLLTLLEIWYVLRK